MAFGDPNLGVQPIADIPSISVLSFYPFDPQTPPSRPLLITLRRPGMFRPIIPPHPNMIGQQGLGYAASSKFLGYVTLDPPINAANVAKFVGYAVLSPVDIGMRTAPLLVTLRRPGMFKPILLNRPPFITTILNASASGSESISASADATITGQVVAGTGSVTTSITTVLSEIVSATETVSTTVTTVSSEIAAGAGSVSTSAVGVANDAGSGTGTISTTVTATSPLPTDASGAVSTTVTADAGIPAAAAGLISTTVTALIDEELATGQGTITSTVSAYVIFPPPPEIVPRIDMACGSHARGDETCEPYVKIDLSCGSRGRLDEDQDCVRSRRPRPVPSRALVGGSVQSSVTAVANELGAGTGSVAVSVTAIASGADGAGSVATSITAVPHLAGLGSGGVSVAVDADAVVPLTADDGVTVLTADDGVTVLMGF